MEPNLKDLLLKTSPELNDNEREFIKQHEADLSDEDRDAYSDFLGNDNVSDEPPAEAVPPATTPEVVPPVTPEQPKDQTLSFKSEDEAKAFFKNFQKEQDIEKQKAIDAAKTPEEKRYVEENWKPADWNEGLRKTVEIVKAELKAEADQKAHDEAVKYWEDQWTELSKEKELKPITTPEGKQVHDQIVYLMRAYDLKTFKEGFDMREKFEAVKNGGTPPPTPSEAGAALAKAKSDAQKKAASKVGASNPGETKPTSTSGVKKFENYEEMKKTTSRGILRGL